MKSLGKVQLLTLFQIWDNIKYDCEIEGCNNKTEEYLCERHAEEIKRNYVRVTFGKNCNKILAVEEVLGVIIVKQKYIITKDCMRCRPIK